MGKQTKQVIIKILKISIAVGLIYWLINAGLLDLEALAELIHPIPILAGLSLQLLNLFGNNWRWLTLLRARGIMTTHLRTMRLTMIGIFFNFAFPGGVGGDIVKGYYLVQEHPKKKLDAAMTVLVDRIVGLFSMLTLALIGSGLLWGTLSTHSGFRYTVLVTSFFWVGALCFFALALHPRVRSSSWIQKLFDRVPGGKLFEKLFRALCSYGDHKVELFKAFGISLVSQMGNICYAFVIGSFLGLNLDFSVYFCLVPIGIVATTLGVAPAGIGVGQTAFYFLFKMYSEEAGQLGAIIVTAFQGTLFTLGLVGAMFYMQGRRPGDQEHFTELEDSGLESIEVEGESQVAESADGVKL